MKKINNILLFVISFFLISFSVDAASVSLVCPTTTTPGSTIECTVSASTDGNINGASANFSISGAEYSNFTISSGFNIQQATASGFSVGNTSGLPANFNIGVLKLSVPATSTGVTIGLTNVNMSDLDYNNIDVSSVTKNIKIASSVNTLSSLSVEGATINFNSDTTTYNLTVDSASTVINATKTDSNATISGTGTKNLNYGNNTYEIIVTAENGNVKKYTLNITRPDNRSSNNNLKSLKVSNGTIEFNANTTTYNVTIDSNVTSVTIDASAEDNKAAISGAGTKNLDYGNNTYEVVVTAENGSIKKYTLNITRTDNRSSNNNLKSLKLSNGTINFNANTTTYDVTVDSNISSIKIDATLEDDKATFTKNYGPRTVNLEYGGNNILIKVTSEQGVEKVYKLNITRDDGRSSNSLLSNITLSEGTINFNKNVTEYKLTVDYSVDKIEINPTADDDKSEIELPENTELVVGENEFVIKVTSENGTITEYKLVVTRLEEGQSLLSNNTNVSNILIEGYDLDFNPNKFDYSLEINDKSLNISVTLEDDKAKYEIIGNENLKNGSKITIRVVAEDGSQQNYTIGIIVKEKQINWLPIIIGIGAALIFVILVIIISKKKNNKDDSEEVYEEIKDLEMVSNKLYSQQSNSETHQEIQIENTEESNVDYDNTAYEENMNYDNTETSYDEVNINYEDNNTYEESNVDYNNTAYEENMNYDNTETSYDEVNINYEEDTSLEEPNINYDDDTTFEEEINPNYEDEVDIDKIYQQFDDDNNI